MQRSRLLVTVSGGAVAAPLALLTALLSAQPREAIGDAVMGLTRDASWMLVRSVPLAARTFHPQGLVKIGDELFVSTVEVRVPTRRGPQPDGRSDRDAGAGVGHLLKLTMSGTLVRDLIVGEGSMYHPGGIDYDGAQIWMTVAEYRPDSRSIVYRIDPRTMTAAEVLRVDDHLGAIVHDTDTGMLHAVSWGSRRFYRWRLDRDRRVVAADAARPLGELRTINRAHYVDFQDCKYAGRGRMLCTGLSEMRPPGASRPFRLGGLELIDLADGRPLLQVPVPLWTTSGLDMTHNPSWFEPTPAGLRAYFLPEDETSTLYVYEVVTK